MKKILILLFLSTILFSFENKKIENLMGTDKFQSYNQLLSKIFNENDHNVTDILAKLKNNGLLDLFFNKAKIIHTNFIFDNSNNILSAKLLNDSLRSLGYYYFYPSDVQKDNNFKITLEFKSEHLIDPVALIDEMNSRGCKIIDVFKTDVYNYKFSCDNGIIKEAKPLSEDNMNYINSKGVYWLSNDDFNKIKIRTKKIDSWHPSVWFYDADLNLLNNVKINQKTRLVTLKIPAGCKYIKITDIYIAENFKRGIIVKGLK